MKDFERIIGRTSERVRSNRDTQTVHNLAARTLDGMRSGFDFDFLFFSGARFLAASSVFPGKSTSVCVGMKLLQRLSEMFSEYRLKNEILVCVIFSAVV
jgi:hypothetical protein